MRKQGKCARDPRTQNCSARLSADIIAAVIPQSGKTYTTGGEEIAGRRWYRPPAGARVSSGAKTDHGEPMRPRATLAVSPWFFNRRSPLPMRETSELPNAVPPWASLLRSVPGGVVPFRRDGGHVRQRTWATTLFPNRRLRCCSARVGPVGFGGNRHRRGRCAEGAFRQRRRSVFHRGLTRAGGRKATFADQLRGVDALTESP